MVSNFGRNVPYRIGTTKLSKNTYARRQRALWCVSWHDVVAGSDGRDAGADRLDDGAGLVAQDGGEESFWIVPVERAVRIKVVQRRIKFMRKIRFTVIQR